MDTRAQISMYLNIVWRRKWLLLIPTVLGVVIAAGVLTRLPKFYQASTTILVTPQRMPEEFIRSTVTMRLEESISSLTVQLLSRTYLEKVVREFNLIEGAGNDANVEQACRRMSDNVAIEFDRRKGSWFQIKVEDREPARAAGIADRLAALFIEQNSRRREEQASGTLREVERWLEEKQSLLEEKRSAIAAYKRSHPWELPEDLQANLRLLESANGKFAAQTTDLRNLGDSLTTLRLQMKTLADSDPLTDANLNIDPTLREFLQLQGELADLKVRYTDSNPEVRRKQAEIDDFLKRHPSLASADSQDPVSDPMSVGRMSIQNEIDKVERDIEELKADREKTQGKIDLYTRRINNIPLREAELASLTQDLGQITGDYNDLLENKENASRAEELERNRKGEQFQVQDAAQVPVRPYRPLPGVIFLMGALIGLGLGAAATFVLEFMDQTVRSENQFRDSFPDVRLLVSMPSLAADPKKT